jgi:hypothetical protein
VYQVDRKVDDALDRCREACLQSKIPNDMNLMAPCRIALRLDLTNGSTIQVQQPHGLTGHPDTDGDTHAAQAGGDHGAGTAPLHQR